MQKSEWRVFMRSASVPILLVSVITLASIITLSQTRAADPSTLPEVISVLDDISRAGFTALRTWAFNDGPKWNSLQPEPQCFDERVFRGLDRVIHEAGMRKLRILLCLTDYWDHYGGMKQYVEWWHRSGVGSPSSDCSHITADAFYENEWCQNVFRGFVRTVLHRTNTLTGVKYMNDPTILGWAPANEPRCSSDIGAHRHVVSSWIHSTASFIKALDPRHLVFSDVEGWFGPSVPAYDSLNPPGCGNNTGCDWSLDGSSPHVDVACIHLYPDLWMKKASEYEKIQFSTNWLRYHVDAASLCLKKPLVVSEFGKKSSNALDDLPSVRIEWFSAMLHACSQLMSQRSGLAGTMVWMAAAASYPGKSTTVIIFDTTDVYQHRDVLYNILSTTCLFHSPSTFLSLPLSLSLFTDYDGFTFYFSSSNSHERYPSFARADNEGVVQAFLQYTLYVASLNTSETLGPQRCHSIPDVDVISPSMVPHNDPIDDNGIENDKIKSSGQRWKATCCDLQ